METVSIYKKHQIQADETLLFDCKNFILGAKREKDGWYIHTFEELKQDEKKYREEISEGEYFQTGKSSSLYLAPALPVKPIVFKGSRLVIAPGQKLIFFVKIPLLLQIYFSKIQEDNLLKEIPFQRLSDTWFGEPDMGEAAYALGADYFLDINKIDANDFEAICPISIFNNNNAPLTLERLIIRVDSLTLCKFNKQIVTSVVKLEYKGNEQISSVQYGFSKNFHGDNHEIIAKPRNEESKGLLKINFHFIKNIYRTE
jgi:hypothetical protein